MLTKHSRLLKICLLGSVSLLVSWCDSKPSDHERRSLSRFDTVSANDMVKEDKPIKPVEVNLGELPIVNAIFPSQAEDDDITFILNSPNEDEIMGPPKPDMPLDVRIEEQSVKVDSFEKETKQLEKEVRKKKAFDTGKMVKEAF